MMSPYVLNGVFSEKNVSTHGEQHCVSKLMRAFQTQQFLPQDDAPAVPRFDVS